jgi:ATP-binding cassette subfamily B (MDR/TAP) protein 10
MKETDHHEQGNSQKKQLAIPSTPLKVVDQGSGRNVAVSTKKLSRYQLFRRLLSFISPDLPRIAVGLLALTVNSITNLSFPWILGRALDNAATENLQEFLLNSAGFFLAGSVASWIRIYCLGTATENISNRLKSLLFKSILFQEMEYYETTPLGEVVSLLENDIQASSELFTEKIAGGLRSFNSAVNGSFILYNTSPYLCGVTLSVVPVVGIAAMTLSRYSRRLTNQLRELHSAIYSYSLERYQNISTVRLNNRESFEIEKFSQKLEESKDCSTKRHHTYGLFMSFVNLSTNCSLIAVLRVGGGMIARGELTVGQLTSFAIQVSFMHCSSVLLF